VRKAKRRDAKREISGDRWSVGPVRTIEGQRMKEKE